MYGTDEEFCTLSMIEIGSNINYSIAALVSSIFDESKKNKFMEDHPDIFYNEYMKVDNLYINYWDQPMIVKEINGLAQKVTNFTSNNRCIYHWEGLENSDLFMASSKMKVADGCSSYFIGDKYLLSTFSKVHAINAADKVSVKVYDYDRVSYLYEFFIDKKKYVVKEYLRCRKI
jgi:hypothetical protein